MAMKAGGSDELNSEINVTPLVDVMLVLLIIFMITAPMMNTGVDLVLPNATAEQVEDPNGPLVLSIKQHGELFLGTTQVKWSELKVKLAANERVQKEKVLHIQAHAKLPYDVVVTAMDQAKDAGAEKVLLLTKPGDALDPAKLDQGLP